MSLQLEGVGGTVLLDANRIALHDDAGSVHTTCAYCGVGCGVIATVEDVASRQVRIEGDTAHPANLGRLCSKGSALGETISLEGRLLYPEVRGQRTSWDDAANTIASEIRRVQAQYGRDAVAFYVSGQLLTEDYYVANKLMKGFLGTANIDTNSRLCMSSSVAGHKRAFGSDTVPNSYEDFELADLIVLTGSNTAWCHPVLFQRIKAEKQRRPGLRVVNIDPRATGTNEIADLHLPLKPGSDVWLFNGLLAHLAAQGVIDHDYLAQHTTGFGVALAEAKASAGKLSQVADATGLDEDAIAQFYRWFANTPRSLTLYSQGVNQSSAGTDKVNSLLNCHLATGRIGKPGSGPFSLTGQPNAMGGREVGGLANQLAAHMELTDPAHLDLVQRFWQAPQIARSNGLKAVDLFEAVHSGNIKLIWIMGTNPVVSMPDADRVKAALAGAECVIVSDCIADTDTNRLAHIKLPARGWGEKDGTVTNSERRISRQRAFLPAPGEAMPDWWIVTRVAQALGYEAAFPFQSAAEVFAEHAALSGFENSADGILRDFDISALAGLDAARYDSLKPVQWPVRTGRPDGQTRLFAEGGFFTPDRKARLLPIKPKAPHNPTCADYPFVLNTGRIRDQWHTMTRTGLTPRLLAHISEPFVEMHPRDAGAQGLREGELARLSTRWGQMLARVQLSSGQQTRTVFVPMHWTGALSNQGRVGALVNPVTDPFSGQPENKHTPVAVMPWQPAWQGFWLHLDAVELPATDYAVAIRGENGWRHELAGAETADLQALADTWLPLNDGEWLEYADLARGLYRRAQIRDGRLHAVLVLATNGADVPERAWLSGQLGQEIDDLTRRGLLSGRPSDPASDVGRTVCACFGVGEKTIRRAIAAERLESVAAIGRCLKAGTNCGSCQPELKDILATCGVRS
ncbi:MAG: molybdopterin-dependent oxidoreductase [Pseudomonadota bacterium]